MAHCDEGERGTVTGLQTLTLQDRMVDALLSAKLYRKEELVSI